MTENHNRSFNSGECRLKEAIDNGDSEQVRQLLNAGAVNVDQIIWSEYVTPIEQAANLGHVEIVKALIDAGFHPDLGNTSLPLCCAVSNGKIDINKLLIAVGADVNKRDSDGLTPLMIAAAKGNIEIVRVLVEAGADVNFQTEDEETALGCAASNARQEVFDYLFPLTLAELQEYAETQMKYALGNKLIGLRVC